jgi:ubiquinone/menaquinone biosynthesis C-methylase UbiE
LSYQGEQLIEGKTIRWARRYDLGVEAMYLGHGDRYRQKVLDLAEVKAGDKVLDIGCGPGRLVVAACVRVGRSGEAYGIDPSAEMIALARHKAARAGLPARFVQGMAEDLPFDDGYFDVLTSSLVIHHLPGYDIKRKAFSEMRRVLKDGGRLLVVDLAVPESRLLRPIARLAAVHMDGTNINDYPEFMESAGFATGDIGEAIFKVFRYVRGLAGKP